MPAEQFPTGRAEWARVTGTDLDGAAELVSDDLEYDNVPMGKVYGPDGINLGAEDVTRGYRVDVFDVTAIGPDNDLSALLPENVKRAYDVHPLPQHVRKCPSHNGNRRPKRNR